MFCIISGDNPCNILFISVASTWRFLWWTETDLSLERSSSNDKKWSLQTILSALSWSLFILWFIYLLWNIQISGQYANCEKTNAFMILLSFFWGMYLDILAKACKFWLTFWTTFKRWFSNVNLWSISIPIVLHTCYCLVDSPQH